MVTQELWSTNISELKYRMYVITIKRSRDLRTASKKDRTKQKLEENYDKDS